MRCCCFGMLVGVGLFPLQAAAQQQLQWFTQFGTTASDTAEGLISDGAGGMYITGSTKGKLGSASFGDYDAYLARLNSAGLAVWIQQFGSNEIDKPEEVCADGQGGSYVVGHTAGQMGEKQFGAVDAFVARVDGEGNQVWIRQFGGVSNQYTRAFGVASDGVGGVYVAGATKAALFGEPFGNDDAFLVRFDGEGNQIWGVQLGTFLVDEAQGLEPDGVGGVFVCGNTGAKLGEQSYGDADAFVARFDALGRQVWLRQFGSNKGDYSQWLIRDGAGGVFVGGYTWGSLSGQNKGNNDAYIARLDPSGVVQAIGQFGTPVVDGVRGAILDGKGGLLFCGGTAGDLAGKVGLFDLLVGGCGPDCQLQWVIQVGSDADEFARGIASDGHGGVYVGGYTLGKLGTKNLGWEDVYVGHFIPECYADCDGSGELDIDDFICFQLLYGVGDEAADCDLSGAFDIDDFICFQTAFGLGCP